AQREKAISQPPFSWAKNHPESLQQAIPFQARRSGFRRSKKCSLPCTLVVSAWVIVCILCIYCVYIVYVNIHNIHTIYTQYTHNIHTITEPDRDKIRAKPCDF